MGLLPPILDHIQLGLQLLFVTGRLHRQALIVFEALLVSVQFVGQCVAFLLQPRDIGLG